MDIDETIKAIGQINKVVKLAKAKIARGEAAEALLMRMLQWQRGVQEFIPAQLSVDIARFLAEKKTERMDSVDGVT